MTKQLTQNRIAWLDIYKGLAIIAMILGHTNSLWSNYVYLFHMSAFFFIAGFTTKLVPNFADFLLKKINTLILPFLAVNLFFIIFRYLCNNFQAEIFWKLVPEYNFIQNLNPLLYLSSTENIGGATWFLVALFFSHLCFQKVLVFVEKIKNKNYFWLVFIPLSASLGWLLSYNQIKISFMLDIIPMALAFIAMGYVARTSTIFDKILSFWWFKYTSIVLGIMTWALGTYAYIKVDYAGRNFDNPFLVLLYGIIGISFFISLAQILARYKITSNIFAAFGQSSMWIMCFHFVAFKVAFWGLYAFDLVPQIQVYELIPIKTHTNFWPLYLIIGLLIPIFLRKSFDLFRIDSQENLKNYSSKCFNIGLTTLLFVAFFIWGVFNYTWIFSANHFYALDDFSHFQAWNLKTYQDFFKLIPAHMYNDRPVGQIFIKLVHDLFGYNYQLQHLIIFLVHCINGVLLYFLILTIKKKADHLCLSSMLIVMLFLAWPKLNIPAEWISAIFDLLGLSLSLLYLLVHFSQWGVIQKKFSLILRLIILIMMSRTKESTLMIPLAAAAFDWFNLFLAQNKWRAIFKSVMIKNIVPVCFSVVYIAYLKYLQTLNPMGFVAPDHPYLSSLSPIVLLKNIFKYCYLFFNLNDWATSYRGYNLVGLGILFIVLALFVGMIFILTKDRQRYWGLFIISLFILTLLRYCR